MAAGMVGIAAAWILAGLVVGDSGWGAAAAGAVSIAFAWLAVRGGIRMAAGRRA
jgi:hypothetical protein